MNTKEYQVKLNEIITSEKLRKLSNEERFIKHRLRQFLEGSRLGLKYFIYAGVVYENTLSFCRERNNKVFSIDEMMLWKNSVDNPDIENYDPILHLGGNSCFKGELFCNHGLNFISNQLAKKLRSEIESKEETHENIDYSTKLKPETFKLIEGKKNDLLKDASKIHAILINESFKKFINEIAKANEEVTFHGKTIPIDEALELLSNKIKKLLSNIPRINL